MVGLSFPFTEKSIILLGRSHDMRLDNRQCNDDREVPANVRGSKKVNFVRERTTHQFVSSLLCIFILYIVLNL